MEGKHDEQNNKVGKKFRCQKLSPFVEEQTIGVCMINAPKTEENFHISIYVVFNLDKFLFFWEKM